MGCTTSSTESRTKNQNEGVDGSFDRHKISINVGEEVKMHKGTPTIIAVFGGPGSKKGRLVDDLSQTFGFKLLNVEKMILTQLSKETEGTEKEGMCDIIGYVKDTPEKINLRWVLSEIQKEVAGDTSSNYIIDIMPNLRGLVRLSSIVKDPTYELRSFESTCPISFAINFVLPLDKLIKKEDEVAKPEVPDKKDKSDPGTKSDEADLGRTKKRAVLFDANVQPFVDYFRKTNRVIHIDVSCGQHEAIWGRLCEVLADLKFKSFCNINTVIIVVFDEKSLDGIDLSKYNIQLVNLEEHLSQPVDKVLKALNHIIIQAEPGTNAFAVNLAGTSLVDGFTAVKGKKDLIFVDDGVSKLDSHVKMLNKGTPCSKDFKAVSSLDNQVCLFPADTDLKLCRNIADYLLQQTLVM